MAENKAAVEPWMRGTHEDLPAVLRAVIHALELAREDVQRWCAHLTDEEWNLRPQGLAPSAFATRTAEKRNGPARHGSRGVGRVRECTAGDSSADSSLCRNRPGAKTSSWPQSPSYQRGRTPGSRSRPHVAARGTGGNHGKTSGGLPRSILNLEFSCEFNRCEFGTGQMTSVLGYRNWPERGIMEASNSLRTWGRLQHSYGKRKQNSRTGG